LNWPPLVVVPAIEVPTAADPITSTAFWIRPIILYDQAFDEIWTRKNARYLFYDCWLLGANILPFRQHFSKRFLPILPNFSVRIPECIRRQPLIAYSIENALGSKYIDRVVVSTDDAEIADVSGRYGAMVIPRPKKYSGDKSPTYDAISHAIDWLKERNEYMAKQIHLLISENPDKKILVPFAAESPLSGIGHLDFMNAVWYKRTFSLPEGWEQKRVLLHFEACDYKVDEKQFECGECRFFISEEEFIKSTSIPNLVEQGVHGSNRQCSTQLSDRSVLVGVIHVVVPNIIDESLHGTPFGSRCFVTRIPCSKTMNNVAPSLRAHCFNAQVSSFPISKSTVLPSKLWTTGLA
jgi:hypothetical protein